MVLPLTQQLRYVTSLNETRVYFEFLGLNGSFISEDKFKKKC